MQFTKLLLLICVFIYGAVGKYPNYIHICKRSDPKVSKCVKESIEFIRPYLKSGIPEIGVPPVEPLRIDSISMFNDEQSTSTFKLILKNVLVSGLGDFIINKIRIDVQKHHYRLDIKLPVIRMKGQYEVNSRLITGNGYFNVNITDCNVQGLLKAEIKEKPNNKRQLIFQSMTFSIVPSDYSIQLENLFKNNPELTDAVNDLLNNNKEKFLKSSIPYLTRRLTDFLINSANRITDNLEYDEIFPE